MEITEVRIKLVEAENDKLRAFCSITLDNDFVIRDLKVIDGAKGPFVAMPSRKLMERCPHCRGKNHYRARFCNECGGRLKSPGSHRRRDRRQEEESAEDGGEGARAKLHAEIAHPINSRCREMIHRKVLEKFQEEQERSRRPGYRVESAGQEGDDYDDYFQADGSGHGEDDRRAGEEEPAGEARGEQRRGPDAGAAQGSQRPAFDEPHPGPKWEPRGPSTPIPGPAPTSAPAAAPAAESHRPADPERAGERGRTPAPDSEKEVPAAKGGQGSAGESEAEDNFGAGIFP